MWSRLGVQFSIAVFLIVVPYLAYDAYTAPARWATYKAEHACWLRYKSGVLRNDVGHRIEFEGWQCDTGLFLKKPNAGGVGGI